LLNPEIINQTTTAPQKKLYRSHKKQRLKKDIKKNDSVTIKITNHQSSSSIINKKIEDFDLSPYSKNF
jgi:hypothetical protein